MDHISLDISIIQILQWFIAAISAISVFVVTWLIRKMTAHWEKQEKRQEMHTIKFDAMIGAISNLNHGIGDEFKNFYEENLDRLMKERNFINKS